MLEVIWGLLGAFALWFIVEVVVGGIAGELLRWPVQLLLGPPVGKFVVALLWVTAGVVAYFAWRNARTDWADYWAWMISFFAALASLLAAVFSAEGRRERDRRGVGA